MSLRQQSMNRLTPNEHVGNHWANPGLNNCVANNHNSKYSSGWGWLGALILWFIIFTVLFWLIYYSLKPGFVLNADGDVDTGKVLLASVISSLILVIIIWLIKAVAFSGSYC